MKNFPPGKDYEPQNARQGMASVDGVSPQVRRIAILVTSLDSAAGRQLLMAMPSGLARDVRKAMASLNAVDPDERRQVLAEFRNQAISASAPASVAAAAPASRPSAVLSGEPSPKHFDTADAPAARQVTAGLDDDSAYVVPEGARPWAQLDVASLTDLLRGERSLVIAVVLSQLQPKQAARLLEQFPRDQHRAVLAHLTSLGDVDPDAMQAIDEHLASRIADYHHRRDNQNESAGRMQELLAAASPEHRGHWQEIIADSDYQLAQRLGISQARKTVPVPSEATVQPLSPAASGSTARATSSDMLADNIASEANSQAVPATDPSGDSGPIVLPFPAAAQAPSSQIASAHHAETIRSAQLGQDAAGAITTLDQILELPPRTIARVLAAADGQVVLLALAGATPGFMQRFTSMLQKPDARALQARLSTLGAINLQDIDEAQRRLCELASYLVGQMRSRHSASSAARAAA